MAVARERQRLSINPEHDDFPALLAEALDVVVAAEYDLSAAASTLGVSTSQLVKFLEGGAGSVDGA